MQTLLRKQEIANDQLEFATFPLLIVRFFFKINRVQAVHDTDELCKFHENLTTNPDCNT